GASGAALYFVPLFFLRRRPDLLFWIIWLWCMAGGLTAMDLGRGTKHLFHVRYTMAAGPAVYALFAALLRDFGVDDGGARSRITSNFLPAVTTMACLLSLGAAFEEPQADYREMARFIDAGYAP